jgi:hypothetical protein
MALRTDLCVVGLGGRDHYAPASTDPSSFLTRSLVGGWVWMRLGPQDAASLPAIGVRRHGTDRVFLGGGGLTGGKLRRGAIELETCLHRFPLCVLDPAVSGTKGLSACRFRAHHSRKLPVLSFLGNHRNHRVEVRMSLDEHERKEAV